jgi:hypothetical protein
MNKLFLIAIILIVSSCTKKEFCIEPNAVFMTMAFKTYDSSQAIIDTPLINASVYSLDTTYLYADNVPKLSAINVYLNRALTQQTFVVHQNVTRDTINVFYKPELVFLSNGCGYQTYFELENVEHSRNSIDSVKITNAVIAPSPKKYHLEVIFK